MIWKPYGHFVPSYHVTITLNMKFNPRNGISGPKNQYLTVTKRQLSVTLGGLFRSISIVPSMNSF